MLKAADAILRVAPQHGETLTMKGLALSGLGKVDKAEEAIKKGIQHDMSDINWLRYSRFCQDHGKWEDALRATTQAARLATGDSVRVLTDAAMLSIQVNDREGFLDAANAVLAKSSDKMQNWRAVAVAYYLLGNMEMAVSVMEVALESSGGVEDWAKDPNAPVMGPPVEMSEQLLFMLRAMIAGQMYQKALDFIESRGSNIADKDRLDEMKGQVLLALQDATGPDGPSESAPESPESVYRGLIARNTENLDYHKGLLACHGVSLDTATGMGDVDAEAVAACAEIYAELVENYPRSHLIVDIAARLTPDDAAFEAAIRSILPKPLRKGTPSLFQRVQGACGSPSRFAILERIALEFLETASSGTPLDDMVETEPPSTTLWVMYFLANLYLATDRPVAAMETVEKAISHTPTVVDLYVLKSEIYAASGDGENAAEWIEYARSLDLQDRFLNTHAVKRLLAVDRVEDAMAAAKLFTKDSDKFMTIFDVQALWYMLGRSAAHERRGEIGPALRMNKNIFDTYKTFTFGQNDFHSFCFRQGYLNPYVDMLEKQTAIRSDPRYATALLSSIRIFSSLAAKAAAAAAEGRELVRVRHADRRSTMEAYVAAYKADSKDWRARKEDDPFGYDLEDTVDPGKAAADLLEEAIRFHPSSLDVHAVAVQVHLSRSMPVLATKSALRLLKLDPTSHQAILSSWRLFSAVSSGDALEGLHADVASVIQDRVNSLGITSLESAIAEQIEATSSLDAAVALISTAASEFNLPASDASKAKLASLLESVLATENVPLASHAPVSRAIDFYAEIDPSAAASFRSRAAQVFPLCPAFHPSS